VKYAAADRFLAVSQAVKDSLLAAGIPESRVAIVPDGLPPEAYVVSPCPTAPPLRLVHVGAFDGRKGQSLVIEVLSRLVERGWDLSAVFLGDGPSRGEVEKAARAAGVSARCEFAGVVNDVPERLASSHLLLLPSDSEGAPLALVEAMAAGCPVLAHDVGGTAEVVRQGVAGRLVSSLDPEVWTTEVIRLLGDPKLRAGFVEEGRRAAAERTIQRTVILLESHLNDVLAASQTAESARPK
jgi:glycosyltransferase involved in cell wall biosynthesis